MKKIILSIEEKLLYDIDLYILNNKQKFKTRNNFIRLILEKKMEVNKNV